MMWTSVNVSVRVSTVWLAAGALSATGAFASLRGKHRSLEGKHFRIKSA